MSPYIDLAAYPNLDTSAYPNLDTSTYPQIHGIRFFIFRSRGTSFILHTETSTYQYIRGSAYSFLLFAHEELASYFIPKPPHINTSADPRIHGIRSFTLRARGTPRRYPAFRHVCPDQQNHIFLMNSDIISAYRHIHIATYRNLDISTYPRIHGSADPWNKIFYSSRARHSGVLSSLQPRRIASLKSLILDEIWCKFFVLRPTSFSSNIATSGTQKFEN